MIVVEILLKIVNSTVHFDNKPTYEDAILGTDKNKWISAMQDEIESIK